MMEKIHNKAGLDALLGKYKTFRFEGVGRVYDVDSGRLEVRLNYSLDGEEAQSGEDVAQSEKRKAQSGTDDSVGSLDMLRSEVVVEKFCEKLWFPISAVEWEAVDKVLLDRALEGLLLVGGISYYKAYCPARIETGDIRLCEEQAAFWTKLYERGLGEFFYQNDLDFRGRVRFSVADGEALDVECGNGAQSAKCKVKNCECEAEIRTDGLFSGSDVAVYKKLRERCLLPIGGGKDSIVSGELLKMAGEEFTTFSLRDAEAIRQTSEVLGGARLVVGRELAPRLVEMNAAGALNGHVPITAYISFLLGVAAVLYDYKYLVLSLEKSANFGQVIFHGMDVNHQYSKSEEFEGDFRNYVKKYICEDIEFFSLLRGFYEIEIARIFAGLADFERYAPIFTSCNANFKIVKEKSSVKWCCHCPKCLFVFIILAAFVPKSDLVKIFGEDLLDNSELLALLEETLGVRDIKPFECVGTFEESQLAMWKISQKPEWQADTLVRHFVDVVLPGLMTVDWSERSERLLAMQEGHFIPDKFLKIIEKYAN